MDDYQHIETDSEAKSLGSSDVQLWLEKIQCQLDKEKDWRDEAKRAEKIYEGDDKQNIYFNILHSNAETLIPALYNSQPVPDVRRRWDNSDPVAKQVVDVTERLLIFSIDQYDFDDVAVGMALDGYVAGRGVTRLRYEPTVHEGRITSQATQVEHVPWDLFIPGPAKSWARMPWVAFKHYLSRDELVKLSGEKGKDISLDCEDGRKEGGSKEDKGVYKSAIVYEIWNKASKEVIFIAESQKDYPLKVVKDPLELAGFFPCAKPFQPINRLRSMVPVCPYTIYEDLVAELNDVTRRIQRLTKQVRVTGIVDNSIEADVRALEDTADGEFITARNSSAFAQGGGGLEKGIAYWPLDSIITSLAQLYQQREQIKQTIYEVTGLSDILRGATEANETATAQNIKTQWGSLRIQNLQSAIAKWAREVFRQKVDLFTRHYEPAMISQITALPSTPEQEQQWPQVIQMFQSDMVTFKIDIETDSTIRADMVRSQETMNQFLAATGQFAQNMGGIIQLKPDLLPTVVEIYTSFARKFKLGKQAEDALDQLQTKTVEQEQNPQPEQPDPAQEQAKMEMQMAQQKAQLEQQSAQSKIAIEQQRGQLEQQKAAVDLQARQIEAQLKQQELAYNQQMAELEIMIKQAELEIKQQSAAIDAGAKIESINAQREMNRANMEQSSGGR